MRPFTTRGALVVSMLLGSSAHATILMDWGVETLTQKSDLVVLARVVSKQSFEAENTVMTRTKLQVLQVLKGRDTEEIEILQLGGQLGARIVDVPGDAVLLAGETYLLFTAQPVGQPYRSLVGMGLGAQRLEGKDLTQEIDVPLMLPSGQLREAPGASRRSLREVLRTIRSVEP